MESSNGHKERSTKGHIASSDEPPPLSIAMVVPPWYEVPPAGYGGLEQVCASLIDGLVARGHDVTLFGTGTRTGTEARFVSTIPSCSTPGCSSRCRNWCTSPRSTSCSSGGQFDIVHDHTTVGPATAGKRRGADRGDGARLPGRRAQRLSVQGGRFGVAGRDLARSAPGRAQPARGRRPSTTASRSTVHVKTEPSRGPGAVAGPVRPRQGTRPRHRGLPQGRPAAGAGRQVQPERRVAVPRGGRHADPGPRRRAGGQRRAGRRPRRCCPRPVA